MKETFISIILSVMATKAVLATPSEIVIIRHGDKWVENEGDNLNPTGYLRAIKFSDYYLKKFGKPPDAIFATRMAKDGAHARPIQTVAPLANHPATRAKKVSISNPFEDGYEAELAKEVMSNPAYDNKQVLICWEHSRIGHIFNGLGIPEKILWPNDNYDNVYIIDFKKSKPTVTKLENQYPVPEIQDWNEYLRVMDPKASP
jgi:hypothetical protein